MKPILHGMLNWLMAGIIALNIAQFYYFEVMGTHVPIPTLLVFICAIAGYISGFNSTINNRYNSKSTAFAILGILFFIYLGYKINKTIDPLQVVLTTICLFSLLVGHRDAVNQKTDIEE